MTIRGFLSLPLALVPCAVALGARDLPAQPLLSQSLADLEGRILTVSKLVYAPGQSATPHRCVRSRWGSPAISL